MKLNQFITNSEYLALAFTTKTSFDVSFSSQQFPTSGGNMLPIIQTRDFSHTSPAGAVDSFQIVFNGECHPTSVIFQPSDYNPNTGIFGQSWNIGAFRLNQNTIRVVGAFAPPSQASTPPYCPALSCRVIVNTAVAPNIV